MTATVGGSAVTSASTISGPLTGATLPATGKGVASVRAISPKTLAIVAADRVSGGRFSLTVPAGAYFLLGTTSPFRGKGGVDRSVGTVKVKRGASETVRLSLKPRKKKRPGLPTIPKIPGFPPTAQSGHEVNVDYPAVALRTYKVTVADPQFHALGNGLPDMLAHDLLAPLKAKCNGTLVERRRFDAILAEHALQQSWMVESGHADRVRQDHRPRRDVTGTISGTANNLTITSTVTDVVSGRSRSVTHHGTNCSALERKIADTVGLICGEPPPRAYVGTLQGSFGIQEQMLRWAGAVRLKFNGYGPGGAGTPPGEYATYVVEEGSLHVTLDGVDGGVHDPRRRRLPAGRQPR